MSSSVSHKLYNSKCELAYETLSTYGLVFLPSHRITLSSVHSMTQGGVSGDKVDTLLIQCFEHLFHLFRTQFRVHYRKQQALLSEIHSLLHQLHLSSKHHSESRLQQEFPL